MGEHDIKALSKAVDALLQAVSRNTEELRPLLAPLAKLPQITEEAQRATQQGLSDVQQTMIQTRLAEVHAGMQADRAALTAEEKILEKKIAELKQDTERIGKRYGELMQEIDKEVGERVRALDSPVLALLEKFFPGVVESRYVQRVLPGRVEVDRQTDHTGAERKRALREALSALLASVRAFIESRAQLEKRLSKILVEVGDAGTEYYMPVYVVRDGEREHLRVGTSALDFWSSEMSPLEEALTQKMTGGKLSIEWKPGASTEAGKRLVAELRRVSSNPGPTSRKRAAALLADQIENGSLKLGLGVT